MARLITAASSTVENPVNWVLGSVLAIVLFLVGHQWIPIPFGFWDLWTQQGSILNGLQSVWWIFAWGFGATLLVNIIAAVNKTPREQTPGKAFVYGVAVSFLAGFTEEIVFRWLRFILSMFVMMALNFITFGLVKWFYVTLMIPFVNWLTFGFLAPQLTDASSWIFAAAIIAANSAFQQGHEYLGLLGYVNSWFLGMVMFWLMFNYGLWTAIVAHVAYDLCVFSTRAVMMNFRPKELESTKAIERAIKNLLRGN